MNRKITHREYYAQFVTQEIKQIVEREISFSKLKSSADEHLNDIPLIEWDYVGYKIQHLVDQDLKAAGDFVTQCGLVCTAKEAARQILETWRAQGGK